VPFPAKNIDRSEKKMSWNSKSRSTGLLKTTQIHHHEEEKKSME